MGGPSKDTELNRTKAQNKARKDEIHLSVRLKGLRLDFHKGVESENNKTDYLWKCKYLILWEEKWDFPPKLKKNTFIY